MLRRAATVGWKWPKRASQVLKKSFESIFVSRGKAKLSDDQQKTSKMRYATFWKQWSTCRFARNQICSLTSLHLRLDVPLKKEQVACPRTRRCGVALNFLTFCLSAALCYQSSYFRLRLPPEHLRPSSKLSWISETRMTSDVRKYERLCTYIDIPDVLHGAAKSEKPRCLSTFLTCSSRFYKSLWAWTEFLVSSELYISTFMEMNLWGQTCLWKKRPSKNLPSVQGVSQVDSRRSDTQ